MKRSVESTICDDGSGWRDEQQTMMIILLARKSLKLKSNSNFNLDLNSLQQAQAPHFQGLAFGSAKFKLTARVLDRGWHQVDKESKQMLVLTRPQLSPRQSRSILVSASTTSIDGQSHTTSQNH
jgi:hypothetical protein